MPFEKDNAGADNSSTSTLLKLQGKPLGYVNSLKTKWRAKTGKELHKGTAVALLLNNIPKSEIEKAIKNIVGAHK